MIKVSIIIPAYNAQLYLSECLESLVNQTYKNIEILVIDDESVDNTRQIMENYKKKDNRIKCLYNNKNLGANIARTNGIKACTGDYLMFIDSDDYLSTDTIEILVNIIERDKVDIVKFNYINRKRIFNKDNYYNEKYKKELYNKLLTSDLLNNLSNEIVNKNLIDINQEIYNIESSSGEDLLINLEIFDRAKKIKTINKEFYYYRYNTNSTTNTEKLYRIYKNIEEINIIYESLCKFAKRWDLFTIENKKRIELRETEAIFNNIIKILNSSYLQKEDFNKIKSIINNSKIINKVNKKDIKEIKTNFINKIIYKLIYEKNIHLAKVLLNFKNVAGRIWR